MSSFVCFLKEEKVSWRGVMMPCRIPITKFSPKARNIRKKRMDHRTDPEMNDMASMKDRNAKVASFPIC